MANDDVKTYKVSKREGIGVPVETIVILNEKQASDRRHQTKPYAPEEGKKPRAGWFILTAPTMFKCGETFKMIGDIDPLMAECLTDVDGAPVRATAPAVRRSILGGREGSDAGSGRTVEGPRSGGVRSSEDDK